MKRKDCYFGLHFDFHATEETKDIGKDIDANVIERIIQEVKPDYIQCDTKGHPGYSSYPTKVGNPAPSISKDILRVWRDVTKKHNVLLLSHYSGIWDKKAMADHPEWASVSKGGCATDRASVFGKYADELLIPQLKELAIDYEIDGAWIDGECWAFWQDYSEMAKNAWQGDMDNFGDGHGEYHNFLRNGFFNYVRHYVSEVKKVAPNFEITSNWFNSQWLPNDLDITDFISGDLCYEHNIDSVRFVGRVIQSFGRNWDLMSWAFSKNTQASKSAVQLCQEAAFVISLGGGYQIYSVQDAQKTVQREYDIAELAKVAQFVRKYQPHCQNSELIPDVGFLYSKDAFYRCCWGDMFNENVPYNWEIEGLMSAFCDAGRAVSVILAERADKIDFSQYKTIVVSDLREIEEIAKEKLLAYIKDGGEVVFCGVHTIELFAEDLAIQTTGKGGSVCYLLSEEGYLQEVHCPYIEIARNEYLEKCLMYGCVEDGNSQLKITMQQETIPSFLTFHLGRGLVGVLPTNIGEVYRKTKTYRLRNFIKACLSKLGMGRVSCNKNGEIDVVLTKKGETEYIHLVNRLGDHNRSDVETFDSIPSVYGVEVEYATEWKPERVINCDNEEGIDFIYENGKLKIVADIEVYKIFRIEY